MTDIVPTEQAPIARRDPRADIGEIIRQAVETGNTEMVLALKDIVDGLANRQAAQEFNAAFAGFQATIATVPATRTAKVATRAGGSYEFMHAELDVITEIVRPLLYPHGLSFTFTTEDRNGKEYQVCILKHVGGHSEQSSCPIIETGFEKTGMNDAQKVGAGKTYARRYTLLDVLGLAVSNDTDGMAPTDPRQHEPLTTEQLRDCKDAIIDVQADEKRLLKYLNKKSLGDLTQGDLPRFHAAIEQKRAANKAREEVGK